MFADNLSPFRAMKGHGKKGETITSNQAYTTNGPRVTCDPRDHSHLPKMYSKVRPRIIDNRTNSSLAASFWGMCLLSYFCDD